ncbi:methyl-accepting chemotaxis protein [Lysobacter auxotrophicus]|uniref:Methyl-accepting chemotaxis protein n=1 Tax=Lysobacter auxotrophicus TaxID=2992573 RepID=A0ABN6UKB4_9GAMM|nr:methyl-accepting chemotaxis protein [Lysobacter auxotrophicus]BDU16766.1 methyl-accepting chemotaxis protein [Lysobacter auxotrophicus]
MSGFKNLSIAKKLAVAFAVVIALAAMLGGYSILQLRERNVQITDINRNWVPSVRHLLGMRAELGEYRTFEISQLQFQGDAAQLENYRSRMEESKGKMDAALDAYTKLISSDEERKRFNVVAGNLKAYFTAHDKLMAAVNANDFTEATRVSADESRPLRRKLFESLTALTEYNAKGLDKMVASSEAAYRSTVVKISLGIAALVLLGAGLGFVLARLISRPLQRATAVAQGIAAGRIDERIVVDSEDEAGQLLRSMSQMQVTLQRFAHAQGDIARRHDAGEIDFRIDNRDLPGAYGQMAGEINALVDSHIQLNARAIGIVAAYARGDLSQDMDRLPAQKARITDAVDSVKSGMNAINAEIKTLVDAAVAGDFTRRGDAARFQFVYRDVVNSLNQLMSTADNGLNEVGSLLSAVADGDLNRRVDVELPGHFGRLASDANRTVDKLSEIVGQIRQGSDAISSAAAEIAAGNNDLSQRTESQAASLEETASSMEELTSTVRQNADNARQANQLAQSAAEVAGQGGTVVGEVVETMNAINQSSKKIADIIGVIDGIAFQTNILALNAAVEAARAGEQGRGFAVVAAEVRSLAQRSANAAKEIKQLITDSVVKVEEGSQLVDQAGKTMEDIVSSVRKVTGIIADISAASQEQSAGIEQINQAITQMDEGTQQNAALVEEASAAARSLEQQSEQLVQTVAVFRVANAAHAGTHTRTAIVDLPTAPRAKAKSPVKPAASRPAVAPRKVVRGSAAAATDSDWQEF